MKKVIATVVLAAGLVVSPLLSTAANAYTYFRVTCQYSFYTNDGWYSVMGVTGSRYGNYITYYKGRWC